MKTITTLSVLLVSVCLHAQVHFPDLHLSEKFPKASCELQFRFAKARAFQRSIIIFEFSAERLKSSVPALHYRRSFCKGKYTCSPDAVLLLIYIKEPHTGKKKIYLIPLYSNNHKPVQGYYAVMQKLLAGREEWLFDPVNDLKGFYPD